MQKLLMLGTSSISCEMVKYAKSKGIYTIVTDPREPKESVAKLIADEYWMINTGEIDLLEKKCREEGVTAVICGISEFCLDVCMELCKRLGFPCYCTPEAWHYSRDKEDFKKLCKEVGAPVATDYYLTDALTDEELATVKFPVVVKPVDMSGNRGVSYCYNKEDLIKAWKYARSVSKSSKMIVERMLHGEEWYSSYAFSNGEPRLLALNAMYAQPGEPKFCYTVTTTVSNHVEQYIREINPACYGEGEGRLLLSPGAVDMGGLWAVPEFKDYDTLTAAQVQALYDELCLSRDELSPIIRRYNNPWDYA